MTGLQFDDSPYTQLTAPARGDIKGVIKDISEVLPENQTKFITFEDDHQYGSWASKVRSVTASGSVTLANSDPMFIEINPNGSNRDVNFPAKSDDNHAYVVLHSGSANTLTLKRSGGATIATLAAGEARYIMPSTLKDFTAEGSSSSSTPTPDTTEYKLSVTVSASDLIVAIKDKDGNNPSAGSPVKLKIGDTIRTLSTSLSVTLVDGTNWFSFGSADKATVEQDLFIYLGYNATDGITIGVSAIPYASKYGDFSTTATNETYCKISTITTAASTDPYIVIGRCAATLSAGTGYTWTVPTFDNDNLKHVEIHETRKLTFTAQPTNLTIGNGTMETYYQRIGRVTKGKIRVVFGSTTSIGGNVSFGMPTTHKHSPTGTTYFAVGSIAMVDSGVALYMGEIVINAGSFEVRAIGAAGTYANWAYMTSTVPHTWGSTDILEIDFEYFN